MEAMHPVDEEPYEVTLDNHGCCNGPKTGRLRVLNHVSVDLEISNLTINHLTSFTYTMKIIYAIDYYGSSWECHFILDIWNVEKKYAIGVKSWEYILILRLF